MDDLLQYLSALSRQSAVKILTTLLIFVAGWLIISRLSKVITRLIERGNRLDPSVEKLIAKVIHVLLIFVLLIICMGQLGLPSTSLITILGSLGLAASLAFQDTLKNLAGGIIIMTTKPFVTGNFIEAPGASGTVTEIGLAHTLLHTPDNRRIYVPNGTMASATVVNYSLEAQRRVEITIPVPYNAPTKKARDIIEAVVAADGRILADPEPFIRVWAINAASVDIIVRVWTAAGDFFEVKAALLEGVKIALDEQGISVPMPVLNVSLTSND